MALFEDSFKKFETVEEALLVFLANFVEENASLSEFWVSGVSPKAGDELNLAAVSRISQRPEHRPQFLPKSSSDHSVFGCSGPECAHGSLRIFALISSSLA